MRSLSGDRGLGQDCEIEIAAVLLPGFFGHLIDEGGELCQALFEAWVWAPEPLHGSADNYFARWPVSGAGHGEFRGREGKGRERGQDPDENRGGAHGEEGITAGSLRRRVDQ